MSGNRDPDAPEIRAWGAENGWDVQPNGRIPAALRSAWATANAGGASPLRAPARPAANGHAASGAADLADGGPVTFTIPDYPPPGLDDEPDDDTPAADEKPPEAPPRRGWRAAFTDRVRDRRRPERGGYRRRRVSLETVGGLVWAGAAQLCASRGGGRWLPVANIMAFQAPVAGMVAEDAIRGTIVDAVVQPIAKLVESGSIAGALAGPPALVGLVCARPELYPMARPLLEIAMKEWVITAGPKLRELRRREEKFAAEMAAMAGEDDETAFDIGAVLDGVFAPLFAQAQAAAESNGHPAG